MAHGRNTSVEIKYTNFKIQSLQNKPHCFGTKPLITTHFENFFCSNCPKTDEFCNKKTLRSKDAQNENSKAQSVKPIINSFNRRLN